MGIVTIDRTSENAQNSHSISVFERGDLSLSPEQVAIDDKIGQLQNLDQALRLAAQFHLNGLHASEDQMCSIVKRLKHLSISELEPGDGRKVESVRVERRLDGSVSMFFGI